MAYRFFLSLGVCIVEDERNFQNGNDASVDNAFARGQGRQHTSYNIHAVAVHTITDAVVAERERTLSGVRETASLSETKKT